MKDRTQFEETVLDNGITIYSRHDDVEFASIRMIVPFGSAHVWDGMPHGTAHFLEHLMYGHSVFYPGYTSYKKLVGLRGGIVNAHTDTFSTVYDLDIPTEHLEDALQGFYSILVSTAFAARDIAREAGIISNERNGKSVWYPGATELGKYKSTEWKRTNPCSLRQRLGEDSDLALMSVESLSTFHRMAYHSPKVYFVVAGNFDLAALICRVSRLRTESQDLPEVFEPVEWVNREYHEVGFPEVQRFMYHLGGVFPNPDPQTARAIHFVGRFLTNTVHGPLYEWVRHEKGSYGANFEFCFNDPRIASHWTITLPLSNYQQVAEVRASVHERIEKALSDGELLMKEVERVISGRVFWYQKLADVLVSLQTSLNVHGRNVSEKETIEQIKRCADPGFMRTVYENFFAPSVTGEFLAKPSSSR